MRRFFTSFAAIALVLGLASAASADSSYIWDFQNYGGSGTNPVDNFAIGTSANFNSGTFKTYQTPYVTATGYEYVTNPLTFTNTTSSFDPTKADLKGLASKWTGTNSSENGLGLVGTSTLEIKPTQMIKLDFTNAVTALGTTDATITFTISSIQPEQGVIIWNSNADTQLVTVPPVAVGPNDVGTYTVSLASIYAKAGGGSTGNAVVYISGNAGTGTNGTTGTNNDVLIETATLKAVPEPSTLAIAGVGALGFGAHAWRRRVRKGKKA